MPTRIQMNLESNQSVTGIKTLTAPVLAGGVATGDPVVPLGVATKQFVEAAVGSSSAYEDNPLINGLMLVNQRGAVPLTLANNSMTNMDKFKWRQSGTGVVQSSVSALAPTVAEAGLLITQSLALTVTTADAAIAPGDFYALVHRMKGYIWKFFAQNAFTLSFWVRSSVTGVHCVAFRNATATPDRSYIAEYTIAAANTWQKVTITVPASPSAGTWDYDQGIGLEISFLLAGGSTFQTTANAWQTGNFLGTAGQVNNMGTIGDTLIVVGIQIDKGLVARPLKFSPFDAELERCKKSTQKSFLYATAPAQNAGDAGADVITSNVAGALVQSFKIFFSTQMDTGTFTVTTYNPGALNAQVRNTTDAADDSGTGVALTERGLIITFTGNAGNTVGDVHRIHWLVENEL